MNIAKIVIKQKLTLKNFYWKDYLSTMSPHYIELFVKL